MSLFFPAKDKRLANIISIESPGAIKESIRELKKDGLSSKESKALVLARNRAEAQLSRKNLSDKERSEFSQIVRILDNVI